MGDIYIISTDAAYDPVSSLTAGFGGSVERNCTPLFDYAEAYVGEIRAEDAELLAATMGVRKLLHYLRLLRLRLEQTDRVLVETDSILAYCLAVGQLPRKPTPRQIALAAEWQRWQRCFSLSPCKTNSHSALESAAHRRAHSLANRALARARQIQSGAGSARSA